MTIQQIIDIIFPLTKEDQRCGFKKAKKLRARADLTQQIFDYKEGRNIALPDEVLKLLNDQ